MLEQTEFRNNGEMLPLVLKGQEEEVCSWNTVRGESELTGSESLEKRTQKRL